MTNLEFLQFLLLMQGSGVIVGMTWAVLFSWVKW